LHRRKANPSFAALPAMALSAPSTPRLIAATVTPFTAERTIDRVSLTRLAQHLSRAGVREFFVVGSTGEAPLLDEEDRQIVIATVRAAAPTAFLHAGVSGHGVKSVLRNIRAARAAGADAAVVMSPQFLAFSQDQLAAYCLAIADSSELPLEVYHHLRMPTPFAIETVARLAAHPNIVGLKDTNGGDHDRCAEVMAATRGKPLQFFQGVEKLALSTLRAGGHGCVLAQANIAPRLYRALFDAWARGDAASAEALQAKATALWGIFLRPEVRQSFCHFLHTLKLPLREGGVIASTTCAMPGPAIAPDYERMVSEFMREHLTTESAAANA
jgi:4-hydroxy-tetrahydrodipicolinate synthase